VDDDDDEEEDGKSELEPTLLSISLTKILLKFKNSKISHFFSLM
jgi:hypothetical protein